MNAHPITLTDEERSRYEWQMWTPGVGEEGQKRLKKASVLISRVGGVGGIVAYQLAAAGVGHLILAHGGSVKPSDLNRQLLMTHDWLGRPRVESAARRLRELNPNVDVVTFHENISEENAPEIVDLADIIVDCAPLFQERFALNRASVSQKKPMIECAIHDLTGYVTTFIPGQTGCLACLYPEFPIHWKRQFPVFGAVAGSIGSIGAIEVIKHLTQVGDTLTGTLLTFDFKTMKIRNHRTKKLDSCPVCSHLG